ncbi:hypothetical protein K239x_11430 [Planctomycetes bacterium K23_9]|uniref:Uncharacterized protein n=1 Tax=Stieleria marina TaxID=1930275 RepID=A0A517NPZ8_9BACT|nr:hypothetical protein K239x_11430 [Planctomycetes bacterium K23_9]
MTPATSFAEQRSTLHLIPPKNAPENTEVIGPLKLLNPAAEVAERESVLEAEVVKDTAKDVAVRKPVPAQTKQSTASVRNNTQRSMSAVPTQNATYRGVQSTLKMQPVAGPIFGRGNRNGQPLFRLRGRTNQHPASNHKHQQPSQSGATRAPQNLPQPPRSVAAANAPSARVAEQTLRHTETGGWVSRNGTQGSQPLRDPNARSAESYTPSYASENRAEAERRYAVGDVGSAARDQRSADPRLAEPSAREPRTISPRLSEPHAIEPRAIEPRRPVASTLEFKTRAPQVDPPSLTPPADLRASERVDLQVDDQVQAVEPGRSVLSFKKQPAPRLESPKTKSQSSTNDQIAEALERLEQLVPPANETLNEPMRLAPLAKKPVERLAPKSVPAADVALREKSESSTEPSEAERAKDDIREELAKEAKRQQERLEAANKTDAPRVAKRSEIRRDPAKASASASLSRQETASRGSSRVGDLDTSSPQSGSSAEQSVTLDYVGMPATPIQITPYVQRMQPGIARVLQYYHDRPEKAAGRSNWGMMHSIMVYGVNTRCAVGSRHYSTIAWIAGNNVCRGQRLFTSQGGRIQVKSGVGLQGHQAQLLTVLSLCDVPSNYPIYADNVRYSMQDIIEQEKLACKSGEELTFTLIGLSHYLNTDDQWIASDGQRWDFERLIREELRQPIVGAACGGSHRLMGYAHALRNRRAEGKPITGQWARAEKYVRDFVNYTYSLQNRDGSMGTNWYEGRGDSGDVDRKIQTTGHMVEFLLTTTPDSQLQDPRLVRGIAFLLNSMNRDLGHDWKIGPKGHALRSLAMYHDRVFKSGPAYRPDSIAKHPSTYGSKR